MVNNEVDILLVEDNVNDAELTIRSLKKNKVATQIVHLRDGVAALNFLFGKGEYEGRNISYRPKLILLDLKMPKLCGLKVLEVLSANDQTRKIPVVVLTSSKENPDLERSYLLGANGYIVKPVNFEKFCHTVNEMGINWLFLN